MELTASDLVDATIVRLNTKLDNTGSMLYRIVLTSGRTLCLNATDFTELLSGQTISLTLVGGVWF